jgi:hypothetical protein
MQDATLYTILDRQRHSEADYTTPDHFTLDAGTPTDPERLVNEVGWTPYCLDDSNRRVLFVDMPPDTDLSKKAFVYDAQFRLATRVLAVPYDQLEHAAALVVPPPNLIFVFSTGRCGSTLLNHILNGVESVHCLSETDIHSNLSLLRGQQPERDAELALILKSCTLLWSQTATWAGASTFGSKFRSQAVAIMDLFAEAFPDARHIFMYREGVAWAQSFYRYLRRFGYPDGFTGRSELIDCWAGLATSDTTMMDAMIPGDQSEVTLGEFFAPFWVYHLELYRRSMERGMALYPLRYEELITQPEATLRSFFEYCRLDVPSLDTVMKVFAEDSQKGTALERDYDDGDMSTEHVALFKTALGRHPHFHDPDLRLMT